MSKIFTIGGAVKMTKDTIRNPLGKFQWTKSCLISSVVIIISVTSCAAGDTPNACTDIYFAVVHPASDDQTYVKAFTDPFKNAHGEKVYEKETSACYTLRFKLIPDTFHEDEHLNASQRKVFDKIPNLKGIIGGHRIALENYAVDQNLPYILYMPLDSESDVAQLAGSPYNDIMIHMWPTPRNLADAITQYLITRKLTKVHILYGGDVQRLDFPIYLMTTLEQDDHIEHVGSSYVPVEWLRDNADTSSYFDSELLTIVSDIKNNEINALIVAIIDKNEIVNKMLRQFFSEDTGLNKAGTQIIFVDMTQFCDKNDNDIYYCILKGVNINRASEIFMGLHVVPEEGSTDGVIRDVIEVIRQGIKKSSLADVKNKNGTFVQSLRRATIISNPLGVGCPPSVTDSGQNIIQITQFNHKNGFRDQFTVLFTEVRRRIRSGQTAVYKHKIVDGFSTCIPDPEPNCNITNEPTLICNDMKTNKVKILLVLERPFVVESEPQPQSGPKSYEGAGIEILEEIKIRLKVDFNRILEYEFEVAEQYGAQQEVMDDLSWTGAIGRLSDKNDPAMLAVGNFIVTSERMKVVKFTPGFAKTGIAFVYKKELFEDYFKFLQPLDKYIWLGILGVFVVSTLLIFGLDKWNPMQNNMQKRDRYTLRESAWLAFCTINQAGTKFAPYQIPIRIFTVFLWFFTLIVISSYTANLATFLTTKAYRSDNIDFKSLASFNLLTVTNATSATFFKTAVRDDYTEINRNLEYVSNAEEGIKEIRERKTQTVFLADSMSLQFYVGRDKHCILAQSKDVIDASSVAFPMAKDWNLAKDFYEAMFKLKEDGVIPNILEKWYKFSKKCGEQGDEHLIQLDWRHFTGLFIILGAGIIISFLLLAVKLIYLWIKEKRKRVRRPP